MAQPDLAHACWRRSSRSNGGGGNSNCVEVASLSDCVAVRDSKDCVGSSYPAISTGRADWSGFIAQVKLGVLDH